MSKPTISVVVPTFNGEQTVARTLRSIAGQRGFSPQIVVVDDGSSDQTTAAVSASGVELSLYRQSNAGVSRARNVGAAASTGDYLCFVDQDDVWHPDHLSAHMQAFARMPEAGVAVGPYLHWDLGRPTPASWATELQRVELDDRYCGWVFHEFMLDCWALTSATTLTRRVWQASGGFDETREYGEDWDLWMRLSRQTPFVKVRSPAVLYQQHVVQGSRRVRRSDHRTQLLLENFGRYGLSSRDGRTIDAARFRRTVARYQVEFGCHHMAFGDPRIARQSLFSAWRREPLSLRYLALWLAGVIAPVQFARRLRRQGGLPAAPP